MKKNVFEAEINNCKLADLKAICKFQLMTHKECGHCPMFPNCCKHPQDWDITDETPILITKKEELILKKFINEFYDNFKSAFETECLMADIDIEELEGIDIKDIITQSLKKFNIK